MGGRTTQEGGYPQSPPLAGNHETLAGDAVDAKGNPYGSDVVAAANAVHEKSVGQEPAITGDLQQALAESPIDEHLDGLQYRVKEPASLATKIREKSESMGVDAAAGDVHDAIRYTAVSDGDGLAQSVDGVISALEKKGYKVAEVKNFWTDPALKKLAYKGVNVKIVSPEGVKMELQFHTPESQASKFDPGMHKVYDQQKLTKKGSDEWWAYENQMKDTMAGLGVKPPAGYGDTE